MEGSQTLLNFHDVHISFGKERVLRGIDLSLKEGEHIAVLGPGGSGKSTLLKASVGLHRAQQGFVELFGTQIKNMKEDKLNALRADIGIAFQQGALFDFMTVKENILFALQNMRQKTLAEVEEEIEEALQVVLLRHAIDKIPSQLSGGMRRRVGIVRAMITQPKLALLDEPTAGLDPVTTTVVIDMIKNLAEKNNAAFLCVTSSVEVAFTISRKVAILHEGKIQAVGTWEELTTSDDEWVKHFIEIRNFTPPHLKEDPNAV